MSNKERFVETKADRKARAIAKIQSYIAWCLRQADRKTGTARQVYLEAAEKARKALFDCIIHTETAHQPRAKNETSD